LKIKFFEGVFMDITEKSAARAPKGKKDKILHSLRCAASIGLVCGQALERADDEESLRDIESCLEAMALLMKPAAAFLAGIAETARKERKL
jgi:hypothetical protein